MTQRRRDFAVRAGVVLLALGALAIGSVGLRDAKTFDGRTSPGFLTFPNGFLAPTVLFGDRGVLRSERVDLLDLVLEVDGRPVDRASDLWSAAAAAGPGRTLHYTLAQPWGDRIEADVPTRRFAREDRVRLAVLSCLPGLLLLAVGCVAVLARPRLESAIVLFAFSWAMAVQFGFGALDHLLANRFAPWSYAPAAVAIGASFHLAVLFPVRRWPLTAAPRLTRALCYAVPVSLLFEYWRRYFESPGATHGLDQAAFMAYVGSAALFTANVAWTVLRSERAVERDRARLVMLAPASAAAGIAVATAFLDLTAREVGAGFFLFTAWSLAPAVALGIARRDLFEFDAPARRAAAAGVFTLLVAVAYLAIFSALRDVFGPESAAGSALLSLACAISLAVAAQPLRSRVERGVGALLFPEEERAQRRFRRAARELSTTRGVEGLARVVVTAAEEGLRTEQAIFRVRTVAGVAAFASGGRSHGEAALPARQDVGAPSAAPPRSLRVALPAGSDVEGDVRLGPRRDGRAYTARDASRLEGLCAQAALALENAWAWDEVRTLTERLQRENELLRAAVELHHDFEEIEGRSEAIRSVLAQVEQAAAADVPVLILGETGTGKELVANALHRLSPRRDGPLVRVASAAIPETLFESELFGHEKGAFTDARSAKPGRFETADRGTLFLDDVDALPLGVQAKLLRVLQEGEVQRVGSTRTRNVDVRVLAASNRDLLGEVRAGRFRGDLYYRLNVVPIEVPPLRERGEDVLLLAEHFAERESLRLDRRPRPLSSALREAIAAHDWPGNVRELRNVIERAVVLSPGTELELPDLLRGGASTAKAELPLAESLRELKVAVIEEALAATHGNQRAAAEMLGLHRQSLNRTLRELGLGNASGPRGPSPASGSR